MRCVFALTLLSLMQAFAAPEQNFPQAVAGNRTDRFLSILSLVRIPNEECTSLGSGLKGACMSKISCIKNWGTYDTTCADGFGVCCVVEVGENLVSSANMTLIKKDPFNSGTDITYTIKKTNSDVCQFRLVVDYLELGPVSSTGTCNYDYMTVSVDNKFDKVCGTTRNIHFYLDVSTSYALFNFHTDPNYSYTRRWEIYVQQVICMNAAPSGCAQWYWGTSGILSTWANVNPGSNDFYYIDQQEYAMCVRWEAGYCTISYAENPIFFPKCSDLFERPAKGTYTGVCSTAPPSSPSTYDYSEGAQIFYVKFKDTSNSHSGSSTNPFYSPYISYTQKSC